MTLIECFTESHIDNIAACLRLQPEKLIFVGDADEMSGPVKRYKKLLSRRSRKTAVSTSNVQGKDLGDICAVLEKLVKQEDDCVIDLTGGDEPVIMAVGAVLAGLDRNAQQRVRVEKYDHEANIVYDCIHDNRKLSYKPVELTVEELIMLHGGTVHPGAYQPPHSCSWRDLDDLWQIVSQDPKGWNNEIKLLTEFEKNSDSKTQVYLPLDVLRDRVANFDQKEETVRSLLGKLHRCGVIEDQSSRNALKYTYTDPMLRYCTQKAGNVLEIKTLLEGRATLDSGAPFFRDCVMSVRIDWGGVEGDSEQETRNEIDVVLTRGTAALFVSCKNGNIGEEELYKFHTVAHRFGGPHAKKMLIATDLDRISPSASRALSHRAREMDIFLVTDAADLSRDEWRQNFRQAMQ